MGRSSLALVTIALIVLTSAISARVVHEKNIPAERSFQQIAQLRSISNRIVNGNLAEEGQFPYQVSVLALTDDEKYHVCSGSIITPEWVLSAAHCTYPFKSFLLRFGSNQLWEDGELQTTTEVVNHPEYNPVTLNNDVSLLKIPSPLSVDNGVLRSLRLPGPEFKSLELIGNLSRVAGWGIDTSGDYSTALNFVDMEIIDTESCRRVYGGELVTDGVLCAFGFNSRRQGLCGGDSGSPLVVRYDGEWVQVGIAAFGALDACERGFPSGFTRVTKYNAWIKQTAGLPADDDDEVTPPTP